MVVLPSHVSRWSRKLWFYGRRRSCGTTVYEARMSKISLEMLRDINKNTVDFADNYDSSEREPLVLPSRFPNLLVNGRQVLLWEWQQTFLLTILVRPLML